MEVRQIAKVHDDALGGHATAHASRCTRSQHRLLTHVSEVSVTTPHHRRNIRTTHVLLAWCGAVSIDRVGNCKRPTRKALRPAARINFEATALHPQ